MSYQKQNFANGEVLSASQLNHIEDGIVDVESAAKATKTVVDKIIDPTLSLSGKAADAKATGDAIQVVRGDLASEISRAETAEKANADNIATEVERAQAAESALSTKITEETERAKAAEQANADGIGQLKEDLDNVKNDVYDTVSQSGDLFEYPNGGKFIVVPNEDGAYVGGKNVLVVDDYTETKNGITVSVTNGVFSASGTASAETHIYIPFEFDVIKDKKYTISFYDADDISTPFSPDFMYNIFGGKVFDKSILPNSGKYSTKVIIATAKDNYKIKFLRFYFKTGNTFVGSCKLSMIIGSHINESFPVWDYSAAPSYEYSSMPEKITKETEFNTDGYICVSSFESVTVNILSKKNISYDELVNKPKINGVEIFGNKSASDFNIKIDTEKNNSVSIERKYSFGSVDLSKATIGDQTNESTISNGTLYPVLVNNTPNGEISDLFRYSCPVQVSSSTYPAYTSIRMAGAINGGYTVEFYVDDDFEFLIYNSVYAVVVVDGVRVSDKISNVTSYPRCHTKVSFSEKKKRHICLYFGSGVKFHGVVTSGTVTKYEDTRLLLMSDGDSIVEGTACLGTSYSQYGCMMGIMSKILNMDFINVGVGGSGYVRTGNQGQPNMVDRFDTYIVPYNPDLLIVMAGLNDSGDDIETVKTQIDIYWAKVKALNPKYVIMVSPYSPSTTINNGNIAIASYLKDVAEQYRYPYIDTINGKTYDAMGNIISEYSHGAIMTEEHRQAWYSEYLEGQSGYDTTHPNRVGHEWMGRYLANEVFKICKDDFGIVR